MPASRCGFLVAVLTLDVAQDAQRSKLDAHWIALPVPTTAALLDRLTAHRRTVGRHATPEHRHRQGSVERETARRGAMPSKPCRTHETPRALDVAARPSTDRAPARTRRRCAAPPGRGARSAPGACPPRRATTTRRRPHDAGHEPYRRIGPAMGATKRFAGNTATFTDPKRGMSRAPHRSAGRA